jgi:hypothetical protein
MTPHVATEEKPTPFDGDPIGTFSIEPTAAGEVEYDAIFLVVPSHDFAAPCGELIVLPLSADGAPITKHGHAGPSWQWDGNREKPTLSPSIFVGMRDTPPGWHGFVRAGVMETC